MVCTLILGLLVLAPVAQGQKFEPAKAWDVLVKQTSFGPRVPGTDAHLKCRDWLKDELSKSCENVRLQPFTHKWSVTGKEVPMWNILAEQNWEKAKIRVLLVAHWDSRPFADSDPETRNRTKPVLGANDGASGVAVVVELMRALKGSLKDVGIQVLLTDGEDLGPDIGEMLLGAKHYGKNLPKPKPDYGILLDMIGDKDLRVPVEPYSYSVAPSLVTALYAEAKKQGLEKTFPYVNGPWITDDHVPLSEAGVPTIDLIDFTYAPWHTVQDTPDKCSAESLGKVGKLLEAWFLRDPAFRLGPSRTQN